MIARSTAGCAPVWLSLPKLLCPVMDLSLGGWLYRYASANTTETGFRVTRNCGRPGAGARPG